MESLSEDQQSLLANWLRYITEKNGDTLELPPETYQGMGGKSDLVLKLTEMGREPASGKEALYVRNMRNEPRGQRAAMGLTPEAKPIAEMFKRLKDKAVFFSPEKGPATKGQWKRYTTTPSRMSEALKGIELEGQASRTALFERMLGKKSFDLGKMGRVIFPVLLMAMLAKGMRGGNEEESA